MSIAFMSDPDDDIRAFMARKLGEMYAEVAKLIAAMQVATPTEMGRLARRNRYLLYIAVALLIVLIIVLAAHAVFSAGWRGG